MWRYVAKTHGFSNGRTQQNVSGSPHEAGHQQSVMEFRNYGLAITPLTFFMNMIVWER